MSSKIKIFSFLAPSIFISSSGHFRTVRNNHDHISSARLSAQNKKRSNIHEIYRSINQNNRNNNIRLNESPSLKKPLSRTPIQNLFENHHSTMNYARPKSALPSSSMTENSPFHIVHHPSSNHRNSQQQQQQHRALLQFLKTQEIQIEQQHNALNEKQKGINK